MRTYVSVDGGMSDNPRPVLYGSGYESFLPRAVTADRTRRARVVGKHCESGDVLLFDAALPADVAVGDLLAVPVTGAYGHSMGSNYNKVPRPPVVFVADGQARLVVRRETYDDLLTTDVGSVSPVCGTRPTLTRMSGWKDRVVDVYRRTKAAVRNREAGTGRTTRQPAPTARPVDDGVRIEYTPSLDGDPDPGEVVWTWVPYEEDPTLGKDRPVVIIGRHGALLSGSPSPPRRITARSRSVPGHGTAAAGRATPRCRGCSTSTPTPSGARARCSTAAASTPSWKPCRSPLSSHAAEARLHSRSYECPSTCPHGCGVGRATAGVTAASASGCWGAATSAPRSSSSSTTRPRRSRPARVSRST